MAERDGPGSQRRAIRCAELADQTSDMEVRRLFCHAQKRADLVIRESAANEQKDRGLLGRELAGTHGRDPIDGTQVMSSDN
jgi:hypothetical protein